MKKSDIVTAWTKLIDIHGFTDRVVKGAFLRVANSILGTLKTQTREQLRQSIRIGDRGMGVLLEDDKELTATVQRLFDLHRKQFLKDIDVKFDELDVVCDVEELKRKMAELIPSLYASWQALERRVENDLVRLLLGPEGGN